MIKKRLSPFHADKYKYIFKKKVVSVDPWKLYKWLRMMIRKTTCITSVFYAASKQIFNKDSDHVTN